MAWLLARLGVLLVGAALLVGCYPALTRGELDEWRLIGVTLCFVANDAMKRSS